MGTARVVRAVGQRSGEMVQAVVARGGALMPQAWTPARGVLTFTTTNTPLCFVARRQKDHASKPAYKMSAASRPSMPPVAAASVTTRATVTTRERSMIPPHDVFRRLCAGCSCAPPRSSSRPPGGQVPSHPINQPT
jgi:hypothetical protein